MGTRSANTGPMTPQDLAGLAPGSWKSDPAARGEGVFEARKLKGGSVAYYFRYLSSSGLRQRILIGMLGLHLASPHAGQNPPGATRPPE